MMRKTLGLSIVIVSVCAAAFGCQLYADEEFREVLPLQQDLRVEIGQDDEEDPVLLQPSDVDCPHCCLDDSQRYIDGEVYKMTRAAAYHINGGLAGIYVWFDRIVNMPVSDEIDNGYVWGPWDDTDIDPLSRVKFRYVMTMDSDGSFDVRLETKGINQSENQWVAVIHGNLQSGEEPHRGTGSLVVDFDVVHALDSAHPSKHHGRIEYDFDVSQSSPTSLRPNTVTARFHDFWEEAGALGGKDPDPLTAIYNYQRYEDRAGELTFSTRADITGPDDTRDGHEETLNVQSRWNKRGKGKGQIEVSDWSGLEMEAHSYSKTECWADMDSLFYKTYEQAMVTYEDGLSPSKELKCGNSDNCPTF